MAREVLLVEDNPGDAILVRALLSGERGRALEITHVERLREAVALVKQRAYDVVLLDLSLPDSDGRKTLDGMLAAAPELPVVVLTGHDDDEAGLAAVQAGAQDYIVKGSADGALLRRAIHYAQERKRAELTIRRLHRQNELVLRSLGEGVVGCDGLGAVTFANAAALELTRFAHDDLIGRDLHDTFLAFAVDGKPRSRADDPVLATLSDGRARKSEGELVWRRDGTSFPVDLIITPMGDDGVRAGAVMTFHDITARQRAHGALKDQLEFQQQILDAIPDAVFYTDTGGALVGCNRAFEELIGQPRAAMVGQGLWLLLPSVAADEFLMGAPGRQTVEMTGRHGGTRTVGISRSPYSTADGIRAGMVGTVSASVP
ncbi:MAG: PAS domain-containing protein [Alphaproteobacteria bacterium]|nr:PAS domain-containing protein [Alphaproteobacteria bacterium]